MDAGDKRAAVGWVKQLRATQQDEARSTKFIERYALISLLGRAALSR